MEGHEKMSRDVSKMTPIFLTFTTGVLLMLKESEG